jgi:curved DNA-binding protein CbpA
MSSKPEAPEMPDYYAALGVSTDTASIELKRAFHKLALE